MAFSQSQLIESIAEQLELNNITNVDQKHVADFVQSLTTSNDLINDQNNDTNDDVSKKFMVALSPIAKTKQNNKTRKNIFFKIPYIKKDFDAYFQLEFTTDQLYILHVAAGTRLKRDHCALVLAQIFGKFGFDNLQHIQFQNVLNLNVCIAMGILGFYLSKTQTIQNQLDFKNEKDEVVFKDDIVQVTFKSTFPNVARQNIFSLDNTRPNVDPADLQYQSIVHHDKVNNKYELWNSQLNVATNQFEWRRKKSLITCYIENELKILKSNMQPLTLEYLDSLQPYFHKHAKELDTIHVVGIYLLANTECWFIGTMQDVFNKWQLLQSQPYCDGADSMLLLQNLSICYFDSSKLENYRETCQYINQKLLEFGWSSLNLLNSWDLLVFSTTELNILKENIEDKTLTKFTELDQPTKKVLLDKHQNNSLKALLDFSLTL